MISSFSATAGSLFDIIELLKQNADNLLNFKLMSTIYVQ